MFLGKGSMGRQWKCSWIKSGQRSEVLWTCMTIPGACATDEAAATDGRIHGVNGNPTG